MSHRALLLRLVLTVPACLQIGGLWVLNNDSGRSACYDSLCINTSKLMTRFHDFPMPEQYPMYCTNGQVIPDWTWRLTVYCLMTVRRHQI